MARFLHFIYKIIALESERFPSFVCPYNSHLKTINAFRKTYWQICFGLTYSMVQSPSSEANWFAASQEIPRISRNPKVHYRTHKHPPLYAARCFP